MKQFPSRLPFKKFHKPNSSFLYLKEQKSFFPVHGKYALKSLEATRLTFKQVEAGRKSIRRSVKKTGNLYIKVFTYASLSKKPNARMGKGKGSHFIWVCPIKAGQIIYEISGLPANISFLALKKASFKLPVRTKIISLLY